MGFAEAQLEGTVAGFNMLARNRVAYVADEVGMGKTFECIAAAREAGLEKGPHLVAAGVTHLLATWLPALSRHERRFQVLTGATPSERTWACHQARDMAEAGMTFWLLVNHDMLRSHADLLGSIPWSTAIIDEYRKVGLSNPKTQLAKGARRIKAERKWALSGTPMGGRLWNLWGALNWVDREAFPSRWRWLDEWGEHKPNYFAGSGKTFTGRIARGKEQEFYKALAPWLIRRRKREHMPELPPIATPEPTLCHLSGLQRRMYDELVQEGEVRVESRYVAADGVLAELTRLKQIATAPLTPGGMGADSGKLEALLENLADVGIRNADEEEGDDKAVVVSQFPSMFPAWREWLAGQGIDALVLSGAEDPLERLEAQRSFQGSGPRVLFISYGAGGSGIDLDRADHIHVMDETWDPDDLEQAVGRLDRGRPHPITVYRYISEGTIDEYVAEVGVGKALTSGEALELYRLVFRAREARR